MCLLICNPFLSRKVGKTLFFICGEHCMNIFLYNIKIDMLNTVNMLIHCTCKQCLLYVLRHTMGQKQIPEDTLESFHFVFVST